MTLSQNDKPFSAMTTNSTFPEISGYTVIEQLYLGSRTAVYRAMQTTLDQSVVIKLLRCEYPSFGELVQFRNQYTITKNLEIPGVVRPYALEPYGNSYALVIEDFGDMALQQYAQDRSLSFAEILAIALQLSEILHNLHQHRVIHKDIKPANILIDTESKQVKLIDFSIASLLPKETQEIQNPNTLEGTLAYLAPEQTGRMNRGIDYRADYYALGVTLYQLLTGILPFLSDDPLEVVHCHIAKMPIPVDHVNPEIPERVAAIVAKLMAKNAEDRYQSALGLKHDLEQCLTQWKETGTILPFELGQRDVSDRFLIPEKLYGREAEIQTLLDAFDRVAQGTSELMLVAGFSGIGKTAVVNEVHKPITRQNGYFVKGKYDQFQRNIPFSAFVQAFRELMAQLLSESDPQLETWKAKILAAVGESGEVIIEVIPELEQIIGTQPPVPELSGSAAQNRFNLLFQKFIQVFTTAEHPLVMFLDDLQWADSASLNLLKLLLAEPRSGYLLILGAYRDNEVFPAHPLMLTLESIQKAQAILNTITLSPLSETTVNQLVADTLSCSPDLAQPLTQWVYQKTNGNPFFTTQFLKALHEDGWIQFQPDLGYWQCDMTTVRQLALTDDVVEFMAVQLQKLPEATQDVLKLAACVGNQFDLHTLAIVSQSSEPEVAIALWKALQEGLLLPLSESYRFFQSSEPIEANACQIVTASYKFLHDRIQQAAYSLIPEAQKQGTHLRIGQLLLEQTSEESLDEKIFAIVSQFNLGLEQITAQVDRDTVARLNLNAARKARLSAAYAASADYCETALHLVGEVWERQPDFALELYSEAANSAGLIGAFEQVDRFVEIVCQHTCDPLDQVSVLDVQIQSFIARSQLTEAIQVGRSILKCLGVELPEEPTSEMLPLVLESLRQQLDAIEDVTSLPLMSDRAKLAAMNILSSMSSAAYIGCPALYPLIAPKQIELSLQFGNALETPYAYSTYSLILCAFGGEIVQGNRSADIALALMEKLRADRFKAKIFNLVFPFTRIWQESLHTALEPLREGYQAGLESGDLEFAAYCAYNHCKLAYAAGHDLPQLQIEMQQYSDAIAQLKQTTALNFHQIGHQAVLNWLGDSTNPQDLIGTAYDETVRVAQHQAAGDSYSLGTFYAHKSILTYHFGRSQDALEIIQTAESAISGIIGTAFYGVFPLYHALILLDNWQNYDHDRILEAVNTDLDRLTNWAIHAPMNFTHRCDLVRAEQQRVLGDKAVAIELYDRAIAGAKANQYLQEEALANELAAKFYLAWGREKIAADYLQEAYYCYARWGAKAKITDLEQRYPQLLTAILQPAKSTSASTPNLALTRSISGTVSNSNTWLDFPSVLRAAQALSQEIELEKLLATLMRIAIANSGAQSAHLILRQDEQWMIVARATVDGTTRLDLPLDRDEELPQKLIYSVARSQEVAVFDAFVSDRETDPPKSVLCIPISKQGKNLGVLYLENHLTLGAFTHDRVEILQLLASQAAISLENARLYQQVETYSHTLEAEVERKTEALNRKARDLEQALQHLQKTQAQLIQTEKMSSLGQLVAGIAHEINNPINFIQGNLIHLEHALAALMSLVELYEQEYPNPNPVLEEKREDIDFDFLCQDAIKILQSMRVGSDRVSQIVLSLRSFSRLHEASLKAVDIHSGIDSTLLILQHRLQATVDLPEVRLLREYGDLPDIICYPSQINQVFLNIINNAIDAIRDNPNSSAKPEIRIHTELLDQARIRITIANTDSTIPEDIQGRIFDPFFTTKPVGRGAGLGLFVSYSIVKKHGGSLSLRSHPNHTAFEITLPRECKS